MYWLLKWILIGPYLRALSRLRVEGRVPNGPVVIAANHQTELDSLVLGLASGRRVTFVAKSEYFEEGLRGKLYGRLCRATGQIPIPRSGDTDAALTAASQILASRGVWAIYPEGTRSSDDHLHRGRTGAMRVALGMPGVRVVPAGIIGTDGMDARQRRGWRPGRVTVRFGGPMNLERWSTRANDPRAWREATDALMIEISALCDRPYEPACTNQR